MLCISNNSIKLQSFVYTQLKDLTILFLTNQFSTSHLFSLSLIVKHFYLTHRLDPIRCFQSGRKWTWKWWQWSVTPHSAKLQYNWSLTIWWFCVVSRTLIEGVLPPCRNAEGVFCYTSRLGFIFFVLLHILNIC